MTPNKNILVRLSASDDCIILSTYCRQHGRRGRFFMTRRSLEEALSRRHFLDADCGNFLSMYIHNDKCYFTVSWLSNSYGYLTGIQQDFEIPEDILRDVVCNGKAHNYLYTPHESMSYIKLHGNAEKFNRIVPDKRARRAFSKAMRDSFKYYDRPVVHLYPDGSYGFYFEIENDSLCGGLIRHDSTKKVGNATYQRTVFSVHT